MNIESLRNSFKKWTWKNKTDEIEEEKKCVYNFISITISFFKEQDLVCDDWGLLEWHFHAFIRA